MIIKKYICDNKDKDVDDGNIGNDSNNDINDKGNDTHNDTGMILKRYNNDTHSDIIMIILMVTLRKKKVIISSRIPISSGKGTILFVIIVIKSNISIKSKV